MPYKRRYGQKKRYYKRKLYKPRYLKKRYGSGKKMTSYDGVVYAKCSGVWPVSYLTLFSQANYFIGWGQSGTSSSYF